MTTKEIEEKPKWLKKVEFSQTVANQFMKVAKELPNSVTSQNLGVNALYLIATLPEEELPNVETLRHLETSELRANSEKMQKSQGAPPQL